MDILIFLLLGWGIGYYFGQHKHQTASDRSSELPLQRKLASAESSIQDLKSQLDRYEQQGEQSKSYEAQLQTKTEENQRLMEQLAAAEKQIEILREQPATAEIQAMTVVDTSAPESPEEEVASVQPDNLRRIGGIGPKVAKVLNEAGILTFEQIAQTELSRLREILQEAGPVFKGMNPENWSEQAGFAAKGDWDGLKKLNSER